MKTIFISILTALALLLAPAHAHKLQVEPIGVTIRSQSDFLTAEFRGNVQDITQSVNITEAEHRGDKFAEAANKRVEDYFNEHFTLTQGGKKLQGKLETLTQQGSLDPTAAQFTMLLRYPRDPKASEVITIKNTTLDYLPNARLIVSAGGAAQTMTTGSEITLDPKNLAKNVFQNVAEFVWLGVEHIFTGPDHILFILGLLLASTSLKTLVKTLTGFTIAHSITLCLAALGIVAPPARLVEILVPVSIIYVGLENLFLKNHNHRFWIASGFGLVHGFGFADILGKYLPPDSSKIWCLFSFNLGVEIFQVALCAVAFPLLMRWKNDVQKREKRGGLKWETIFKGASVGVSLGGMYFLLQTLGVF